MSKTGTGVKYKMPGKKRYDVEPVVTFTKRETWEFTTRQVKRAAKAVGIVDETPNHWSYVVAIDGVSHTGRVIANSRSEARAATKKALGLKKFPKGAAIDLTNQGQQPKPEGGFVG